ncbi:MAG: (d)CMP kinase [Gemmatimonadales bacterium]
MTPIIAIDGPSASGKSTTARAVARVLGFAHLDSGALYRGVTLVALTGRDGPIRSPEEIDPAHVLREAERRGLMLQFDGEGFTAYLDGMPADAAIRSAPVTGSVSAVSAVSEIREWVNGRLRALARVGQAVVVDGRDIGTVVFPDAVLKVFLSASPETRARRRLIQRGDPVDAARLQRETEALTARDAADSARAVAPLRRAPDAVALDGTVLSFAEQVDRIVRLAREALDRPPLPPLPPQR